MKLPPWCFPVRGLGDYSPVYGDLLVTLSDGVLSAYLRHSLTREVFLAIPKYVFTSRPTPWSFLGYGLERLIASYAPASIAEAVRRSSSPVYHPLFGVEVYEVSTARIDLVCSSRSAAYTVTSSPSNHVEEAFTELSSIVGRGCIRPTGSLLLRSVHRASDLDIVVTRVDCIDRIRAALEAGRLKPLRADALAQWLRREALHRDTSVDLLARLYRPWQRLRIDNVEVSVAFVNDDLRSQPLRSPYIIEEEVGCWTIKLRCCEPGLGDYPARAWVDEGSLDLLLVFDGIYVPALMDGGSFRICGVRVKLPDEPELRAAALGLREVQGVLQPLEG